MNAAKLQNIFGVFILLCLICVPLFWHLDALAIRLWDESRFAGNAYEMYLNGDFFVVKFQGMPDMWSSKPPLMLWCQVFFMKIFGPGEWALRLPSAIAALSTCLILMLFSRRYFQHFLWGGIAAFVLVTTFGYVDIHVTRTGDYDALLAFFTTTYCLALFLFFETKKQKYLYAFFVCLSFAALTKSVAGLVFLPGLFIYALWQKELIALLKNKNTYIGIAIFLFLVLGYYFSREYKNPGYLATVYENELGGRYLNPVEGHEAPWYFYLWALTAWQNPIWMWFIPCGILLGLFSKNAKEFRLTVLFTILSAIYLLVFSASANKLSWYNAPLFPLYAGLSATAIYRIYRILSESDFCKKILKINIFPLLFLIILFIYPYVETLDRVLRISTEWEMETYEIGYFFRDVIKGNEQLPDDCYFLSSELPQQNDFYLQVLNSKGLNIIQHSYESLQKNDKVVTSEEKIKTYIHEHYQYKELASKNNVSIYLIL